MASCPRQAEDGITMSSDDPADEANSESPSDGQTADASVSQPPASDRKPLPPILALSQIAPRPVRWLFPGRLAAGNITVLEGDPGLGKSTLLCEFAARISRGEPLPGGEAASPRP